MLLKSGRFHRSIGVPSDYLGVMGPIFIEVVRPCLEKRGLWNEDMEDAWGFLFVFISNTMSHGYKWIPKTAPSNIEILKRTVSERFTKKVSGLRQLSESV